MLHICYMCYLYLKLRIFLERKVQPKKVVKGIVSFIYSIDSELKLKKNNYYYSELIKINQRKYFFNYYYYSELK